MLTIIALPDSCKRWAPVALVPRRRLCGRCLTRASDGRYGGLCRQCHKAADGRPKCRHCNARVAVPHRGGLCRACVDNPEVRGQYPASKFAARNFGNVNRRSLLPAEPTPALPGSEAKILVMIERAARRECLFHPADGPT